MTRIQKVCSTLKQKGQQVNRDFIKTNLKVHELYASADSIIMNRSHFTDVIYTRANDCVTFYIKNLVVF